MSDFTDDLNFSIKYDRQIDLFIKQEFGNNIIINRPDFGNRQRNGIDIEITLLNGEKKTIEQKIRKQIWNDTAIEYCSQFYINDMSCKKLGWIYTISADLLCYSYLDTRTDFLKCILYLVVFLKSAWESNKTEWMKHYTPRAGRTHKNGVLQYQSYFCAIPNNILSLAIQKEQQKQHKINLNQPSLASWGI